MKNCILVISSATILLLSGCATNGGPEYDGKSYSQIKRYKTGEVTHARAVVITDDGTGSFIGGLIGTVLGSTLGHGNGKTLAMLGGGLGGYYAGKEAGKANAQELTVALDNGENVVVVVKGKNFQKGDRVKIIKDGNKVAQVDYDN